MTYRTSRAQIAGHEIILETGKMAKQANGSVVLKCGNLVLLATAVMSKAPKEGIDFFPLTIEFVEKMYASGKIPGGFFKRETRPSVNATLTARLIDRPIRPCFSKYFVNDVQIVVTVLSYDLNHTPDYLSIIAASAALSVSNIPFIGPVGAALVGYVDGQLVANPTVEQQNRSDLHLVVAGTEDAVLMIEAGAHEVSEELILEAIAFAHTYIRESIRLQRSLADQVNPVKAEVPAPSVDATLEAKVVAEMGQKISENMKSGNKSQIDEFLTQLEASVVEKCANEDGSNAAAVKALFGRYKKAQIRDAIIKQKIRPDGRRLNEIRPIAIEVGVLPSVHGSALFTRGETQSLGVVTLGSADDEQIEDGVAESARKNYYFHYNFPPYSVGEVGNMARTGRRELGHGALAQRALEAVLPRYEDFPYTKRIVSEILESNGSSSMASVCSGSLALMDCGVPISSPVSGIAMGLLMDGSDYTILSDIQGLEDHYGDMDFKVAGTSKGITALQLDIKIGGLTNAILTDALNQAKEGRAFILQKMNDVMSAARSELNKNAPKIEFISIDPEKVGIVIGPGGKMIRKIEEETGCEVIVTDGSIGQVSIAGPKSENVEKARAMIVGLTRDVQVGDIYDGKVVKITTFGAFIELVPGKEALLHISKMAKRRLERVEEVMAVGDIINVEVQGIDNQNRVSLVPHNWTAPE